MHPTTVEEAAAHPRRGERRRSSGAHRRRPRRSTRSTRVLEHEAGDLTCTVEAGIRLSALRDALRPARQRLSLDPPGDPSLGACLAQRLSGPLSHRFGTPRDLVLGVTLVLGDGTIASSGGKVVKNVAGYDLGKLVCGSEGRLALVARVSLRLHPLPRSAATLVVETSDPAGVVQRARPLAPRAERARRPPPRPRGAPARGLRERRAPAARRGARARRRRRERRRGLGRVARAPGTCARAPALRPGGPGQHAHDARRGGRSPLRRDRLRPAPCRRRALRRPRGGSTARSPSDSTRPACSRDPGAHAGLRPLRVLPADLPDVRALERGDGLAARADPADGEDGRRDAAAQPDGRGALRPLSRLHGVRLELSLGRPVRPPDRGDAPRRRDASTGVRATSDCSAGSSSRRCRIRAGCAGRCASHRSAARCRRPPGPEADARARAALALERATAGRDDGSWRSTTDVARVGLLTGCVQSVCFGDVNTATARVLAAAGYEVVAPPQGCCGALSAHAGRAEESRAPDRAPALELRRASTRSS